MNVLEYLKDNILILDGGMGTLLQARGLRAGESPELWNLTHGEVITEIHKAYFDAGSAVINTNTFGANSLHFSEDELERIIKASMDNARRARELSRSEVEKFISLDIGPTGRLLSPYGDLAFEEAVKIFARTVELGVKYGADMITVETMNDSYETKAALLAAKECSSLPVFVTNAYADNGKLLTGASPEAMVALLEGMGADAIGLNCSQGPRQLAELADRILKVASVPVILKPNAGMPRSDGTRTVYDVGADEFALEVSRAVERGVRIVGGCCGTTPEYIKALSDSLRGKKPRPTEKKHLTCVSSYGRRVDFDDESLPVLIGERINPTGKKRLKQALADRDITYILGEGIKQEELGAKVLDVNVGMPGINEAEMLSYAVKELQAVTALPLQLDTADPAALEAALRVYNGKAMINSVNGKEESMRAVFPLAKKYGGLIVALTLDEHGIPETAEGRFEIAKKILSVAAEYGIDKSDIIFDPLAMTVSADSQAALTTLKAIQLIKDGLGAHTSLGVSNVSFGLPSRDAVNSVFFALALENGLSAAIMNPYSVEMMKTYHAFRLLHGLDDSCGEYISFADGLGEPVMRSSASEQKRSESAAETLFDSIVKGLRDRSAELTDGLLKVKSPLDIVNGDIIPALDSVGKGYEEKRIYLPGLLMSAEAAKSAFERIKAAMLSSESAERSQSGKKMTVVIATVKGDIHDIGKNIVKLLLENYGYRVIDLGKDVPPERIVSAVLECHAPLAALSALMTTTVPAMEETIKALRASAPFCRIMVGGAVLTSEYAARIGADAYSKDAMGAVRYAEKVRAELED